MKERIEEKIGEIEEFMNFLIERIPNNFEDYEKNLEKKAVCERYLEKIIEASVDLAFLVVKYLKIQIPADISDTEVFVALANENVISYELSEKMQNAKGMRNIIAHQYGKIDDEIIFEALSSEIEKDMDDYINSIKLVLK